MAADTLSGVPLENVLFSQDSLVQAYFPQVLTSILHGIVWPLLTTPLGPALLDKPFSIKYTFCSIVA